MGPTVTRSQSKRASLGYGGTGALCRGCASYKSPSTARFYQYGPTFLKNAFSTLLNQCHVELRQKGIKHKYGVSNNPLGECILAFLCK